MKKTRPLLRSSRGPGSTSGATTTCVATHSPGTAPTTLSRRSTASPEPTARLSPEPPALRI
eukprot:12273049-Alexandrium_andersonii.AAC.1